MPQSSPTPPMKTEPSGGGEDFSWRRAEGQWLRPINRSFTGLCVLSSRSSSGSQDKQCEVGDSVGPSHTPLSVAEHSPRRLLLSGQWGEKSAAPFNPEFRAACSMGVFVLLEHEPVSRGGAEENGDKDGWLEQDEEKQKGTTERA